MEVSGEVLEDFLKPQSGIIEGMQSSFLILSFLRYNQNRKMAKVAQRTTKPYFLLKLGVRLWVPLQISYLIEGYFLKFHRITHYTREINLDIFFLLPFFNEILLISLRDQGLSQRRFGQTVPSHSIKFLALDKKRLIFTSRSMTINEGDPAVVKPQKPFNTSFNLISQSEVNQRILSQYNEFT